MDIRKDTGKTHGTVAPLYGGKVSSVTTSRFLQAANAGLDAGGSYLQATKKQVAKQQAASFTQTLMAKVYKHACTTVERIKSVDWVTVGTVVLDVATIIGGAVAYVPRNTLNKMQGADWTLCVGQRSRME